jgi:hypothetical protein
MASCPTSQFARSIAEQNWTLDSEPPYHSPAVAI